MLKSGVDYSHIPKDGFYKFQFVERKIGTNQDVKSYVYCKGTTTFLLLLKEWNNTYDTNIYYPDGDVPNIKNRNDMIKVRDKIIEITDKLRNLANDIKD